MPLDELTRHGQHGADRVQRVPVWRAVLSGVPRWSSLTFARVDLAYLANLCHNCGECLYACQYAPPHEFNINVPQTLAQLRVRSYEDYCCATRLGVRSGDRVLSLRSCHAVFCLVMFAVTLA